MSILKKPLGKRGKLDPGHVFFTWDLTYNCNYCCSYCSLGDNEEKKSKPQTIVLTPNQWYNIWKDIYDRYGSCELHLTGGEPFIYPGIMEILDRIIEMHTIECSTNFYWDVDEFMKRVPPDRARIGVSFHPEIVDYEVFLNKAIKMKNAGYEVWINYVAYPPFIEDLKPARQRAVSNGIDMSVLPFDGKYKGKKYPAEYNDREKKVLSDLGLESQIIKKIFDWTFKEKTRTKKKKLCRMGQMYAKIHPDGKVTRCCCEENPYPIGDIMKGTFSLLDEALPCENKDCPCWRCMVVGEEEKWASHWVAPPALKKAE